MYRACCQFFSALLSAALLCAGAHANEAKPAPETAVATFAGGCFWCVESDFDHVKGVLSTTSGYIGGRTKNPTYEEVTYGSTGHIEAVEIRYDPAVVSYETLLEVFWRTVDPTDPGGQFCDRGESYQTAIFTQSKAQTDAASASKQRVEASEVLPSPVVTPIIEGKTFYPAEDYHQDYYKKNPLRYRYYRFGCGRGRRVKDLWGEEIGRAHV